jgi:hypothetical protein
VLPFPNALHELFRRPHGLIEEEWPPLQVIYLDDYLKRLDCKTVIVEDHYVDRDYISDLALLYSRSLRNYPNYCYRLHFFSRAFDRQRWRNYVTRTSGRGRRQAHAQLQEQYLGFCVIRPLAGSPIGRTVLKTFGEHADTGERRAFGALREYTVHLGGFEFRVSGLPFQQQDQGVSACATTALWSAIHCVAGLEGVAAPTPAAITESASRYLLDAGRPLPSESLSLDQMCEATRTAGLAPLMIQSVSPEIDRAQMSAYIRSGFAPVLIIKPSTPGDYHAVCAVGVKLGEVAPPAPNVHFRDFSTAVRGVYVHDDRLGPYASVSVYPHTVTDPLKGEVVVRTGLTTRWPGNEVEAEDSLLEAMIVPVPVKLRLTLARLRQLGFSIADACGMALSHGTQVTMNCRYMLGTKYRQLAPTFGLTRRGLYDLVCGTVMSRYVGIIELTAGDSPLLDVLLDATETQANPAVLACVRRAALNEIDLPFVREMATQLGARSLA